MGKKRLLDQSDVGKSHVEKEKFMMMVLLLPTVLKANRCNSLEEYWISYEEHEGENIWSIDIRKNDTGGIDSALLMTKCGFSYSGEDRSSSTYIIHMCQHK